MKINRLRSNEPLENELINVTLVLREKNHVGRNNLSRELLTLNAKSLVAVSNRQRKKLKKLKHDGTKYEKPAGDIIVDFE